MYKVLIKKSLYVAIFMFATLFAGSIHCQETWLIIASTGVETKRIDFCLGDLIIGMSNIKRNSFLTYGFNQKYGFSIITDVDKSNYHKPNIYPNPVTDAFQISGIENVAILKLVDINGRLLLTKQVTKNESVSVSSLPQGMYILKLITTEGTLERKVIKK